MTDHLLDSAASLLDAGDACRIAHIRTARWISHPVASRAHNAMSLLLDRPVTLRPRGLLLTGPYHNGKTMIAERFAIEHLRQSERQRIWVIQTREGAGLSHFYASILAGLRAPQASGWRSLSRAGEQVDHLLDSLKPRLLIFDEFHSALRGRRQDVKAIFSFLRAVSHVSTTFRPYWLARLRSMTRYTTPRKWDRGSIRSLFPDGRMTRISRRSSIVLRPACLSPEPRTCRDRHWPRSSMICQRA